MLWVSVSGSGVEGKAEKDRKRVAPLCFRSLVTYFLQGC